MQLKNVLRQVQPDCGNWFHGRLLVVRNTTTLAHRCGRGRPPHQPVEPQGSKDTRDDRTLGARLIQLPPYSPDFNPIENAFAKFKTLLRKAAERTVDDLGLAIGTISQSLTPAECRNQFAAAVYDAT